MLLLFRLIAYDALLLYWPILVVSAFLVQLRFVIGARWIAIGLVVSMLFVTYSEAHSEAKDMDAIYLLGSVLRMSFVITLIGCIAYCGHVFRKRFLVSDK